MYNTFQIEFLLNSRRNGMKSALKKFLAATALSLAATTSYGAVTATTAVVPGSVGVALWASCSPAQAPGPALTVTACLGSELVNATGNENLTINGGQAVIDAADGFFTSGNIALANLGRGFTILGFNINSTATNQNPSNVSFVIDFVDAAAVAGSLTTAAFAVGPGGNQFRFDGTLGFVITKVSFTAAANSIDDIKQIRFESADRPVNVPLPGTLALLGLGCLALVRRVRA
jgi:PEP-CTERM motif